MRSDYLAAMLRSSLVVRLHRLSAMIDADAAKVYAATGVGIEQRWLSVLNELAIHGSMSVSDLAQALGLSQPSISQIRNSLERKRLISSTPDQKDSRRRTLTLTDTGLDFIRRLRPMWDALDDVSEQLDVEAGEFTCALERLEQVLAQETLYERMATRLNLT